MLQNRCYIAYFYRFILLQKNRVTFYFPDFGGVTELVRQVVLLPVQKRLQSLLSKLYLSPDSERLPPSWRYIEPPPAIERGKVSFAVPQKNGVTHRYLQGMF